MIQLGIINNKTYIITQLINFHSTSLYSSSWDKTIRCFDIETGQEIVGENFLKKQKFLNLSSSSSGKVFKNMLLPIVKYPMMILVYVQVLISMVSLLFGIPKLVLLNRIFIIYMNRALLVVNLICPMIELSPHHLIKQQNFSI